MILKEYRTGLEFPAEPREIFYVRDGQGRVVESWQVVSSEKGKRHQFVSFAIDGYRNVGDL
jgi:hypothetical protein